MNRRDILKLSVAAQAVQVGSAQEAGRTVANPAPAWKPAVFDAHQNETVVVLTDLIIPATDTPGAKQAFVNRHLDKWLDAAPDQERGRFLEGLAWLDGFAVRRHRKPFKDCASAEQVSMLEALDTGTQPELESGRRFFAAAKRMTSSIYYATEIGFRELNKGGRVPSSFACQQ